MRHTDLTESGHLTHPEIDLLLPTDYEKARLVIIGKNAPVTITGARDDPEQALANLLAALATLGLITDSTTAT